MEYSVQGCVKELYTRNVLFGKIVFVSFLIGGDRFSANFKAVFSFKEGDVVRINYTRRGKFNTITKIEKVGESENFAEPVTRAISALSASWYLFLGVLILFLTCVALYYDKFSFLI